MISKLEEMLIRHEGKRSLPYECSAGKISVGVGRNLEDNPLTDDEIMYLLRNDITRSENELNRYSWFRMMDDARRDACINLVFNLGLTRFRQFKRMIKAFEDRDYERAADELLDSKYAFQVGQRAKELSDIIRTGKY
jgi:lysozyme